MGMGGEEFEGVTQFPEGGLDDPDIAAGFDVGEEFEGVLDDIGHEVGVVSAALEGNELLDALPDDGVGGRPDLVFHGAKIMSCRRFATARTRGSPCPPCTSAAGGREDSRPRYPFFRQKNRPGRGAAASEVLEQVGFVDLGQV